MQSLRRKYKRGNVKIEDKKILSNITKTLKVAYSKSGKKVYIPCLK